MGNDTWGSWDQRGTECGVDQLPILTTSFRPPRKLGNWWLSRFSPLLPLRFSRFRFSRFRLASPDRMADNGNQSLVGDWD